MLNQEITELARSLGAADVGFSDVNGYNKKGFPRAVTVCVRLLHGIVDELEDAPTQEYFAHYRAVNALIDHILLRTALLIEEQGFRAFVVAASQSVGNREDYAGAFPHKLAATRSGLGGVGRSDLFIHKTYGPRVRLGTVLTDAPLETGAPIEDAPCGKCGRCVQICPAAAITGKIWKPGIRRTELVDARACSEYMKEHYSMIGRGSVCGLCMKVCPWGNREKSGE